MAEELCQSAPPPRKSTDETGYWGALLAAQVLIENNRLATVASRDEPKVERICSWLVRTLADNALSPVDRAQAGDALARVGDPRFRDDAWYLPDEPLLGFVNIPAGQFIMGSDDRDDSRLFKASPQHRISLPSYYISRYLATVAQFQAYVDDSGQQPGNENSLRGLPTHPVVRVSWYEAVQYCEWLTERLKGWDKAPEPLRDLLRQGWHVSLPSEAEWEKAARGTDGRIYPWEEEADPNKANYGETGINAISAVGCFPGGASPFGMLDMSGNVWEWTRSLAEDYPYPKNKKERAQREDLQASKDVRRVLRGGAFWLDLNYARCVYRCRSVPRDRLNGIGFRVVLHP